MQEYKTDIEKLMKAKELIYMRILDLLEKKAQSGGSFNTVFFNDNIIRKPNSQISQHDRFLNAVNMLENNNNINLKDAMINSFNRISQNNQ